jgi:hypothetical protein
MGRSWLIAIGVAAVAAAAWWFLRDADGGGSGSAAAVGRDGGPAPAAVRPDGGPTGGASRPVVSAPFADAAAAVDENAAETRAAEPPILCIVETHDGRPAPGAPVAVYAARSDQPFPVARFAADGLGRVVGPTGIVSYSADGSLRIDALDGELRVVATVPGLEPSACPALFARVGEPGPHRTLRLPKTVALRVALVRKDGAPYAVESDVRLFPDGEPSGTFADFGFGSGGGLAGGGARAGWRRTSDGAAEFPYVACGAELTVVAASSVRTERRASETWRAPDATDPPASVALTMGLPALVVRGRAVDGSGAPRANAQILVQPREAAVKAASSIFGGEDPLTTSDDEGRFAVALDRDPSAVAARSTRVKLARFFGEGEGLESDVAHGPPDAQGEIDLGDVALVDPPPFLAGRVVDDRGEPVSGAQIRFFLRQEDTGLLREAWHGELGYVQSGADGNFVVRGALRPGTVPPTHVGAEEADHFLTEPTAIAPGAAVVVRLGRGGAISGTFREGPTRDAAARFALVAEPAESVAPSDGRKPFMVEGAGFTVRGLPPGTARVVVRMKGLEEPLLTVDGVRVSADVATADPRLQNLDLSAHIGALRVRVVDEGGRPIAEASVSELPVDEWQWKSRRTDGDGYATVPKAGPPARIVAQAPGYASADLGRPTADCVVALKRPIQCRIRLTLPPDVDPPAAPFGLATSVRWGGPESAAVEESGHHETPLDPDPAGGAFGADRTVSATVRQPGVYFVQVYLSQSDGNSRSASGLGAPQRLTVGPTDTEVRHEIAVKASEVAERIKEWRR